jgi:hypothetical protein
MDSNGSTATMTTKTYFGIGFSIFLAITFIYFRFSYLGKVSYKPFLFYPKNSEGQTKYKLSNYSRTFFYFLLIFVIQICIAWSVVSATNCSMTNDKGKVINEVFKSTAFPWLFIFGLLMVVVLLKQNVKSVFSNVYGYMWVSSSVNSHLVAILKNEKEVKALAASVTPGQPDSVLQNTADAILKICGNTGILVNQITPDNFIDYMKMLQPLMKQEYSDVVAALQPYPPDPEPNDHVEKNKYDKDIQTINDDNFKINEAKFDDPKNIFNQLYNDVETRDNIGELAWFIYSGVFILSIVTYNLAMISCK